MDKNQEEILFSYIRQKTLFLHELRKNYNDINQLLLKDFCHYLTSHGKKLPEFEIEMIISELIQYLTLSHKKE